jgi:predicted CoA-binding protein
MKNKLTCRILAENSSIAVVGYKPGRISGDIAHLLVDKGYDVVGVNPVYEGETPIPLYKTLEEIPHRVDIVDVFRRAKYIHEIIPSVLKMRPNVLWLQLGIRNDEAVKPAGEAGITVIQDECIKIEYYNCY